jgi:hypothetical protein
MSCINLNAVCMHDSSLTCKMYDFTCLLRAKELEKMVACTVSKKNCQLLCERISFIFIDRRGSVSTVK